MAGPEQTLGEFNERFPIGSYATERLASGLIRIQVPDIDIAALLPNADQLPPALTSGSRPEALTLILTQLAYDRLCGDASAGPSQAVAVTMPNFNGARYVAPAVESVLNQSWADLHLAIVDDGSTDGSIDVLLETLARFPESSAVVAALPHIGSPAVARNVGMFSLAPQDIEYFAFLDSDDLYVLPDAVKKLVAELSEAPDCIAAYGDYDWISPEGAPLMPSRALRKKPDGSHELRSDSRVTWENLAAGRIDTFHLQCLMVRRGMPFLPYQTYGEDGRYFQKLFRICSLNEQRGLSSFSQIPEIVAHYRKHADSLTSTRTAKEIRVRPNANEGRKARKGIPEFHINSGIPDRYLTQRNLDEYLLRQKLVALAREYRRTRTFPWQAMLRFLRAEFRRAPALVRIAVAHWLR